MTVDQPDTAGPTADDLRAKLFRDRERPDDWRVEKIDEDGGIEVALFSGGADPRQRAITYAERVYGEFDEIELHPYHRAPPLGQVLNDLSRSAIPATCSISARQATSRVTPRASSLLRLGCAPTRSRISPTAPSPRNIEGRSFDAMSNSGAVTLGEIASKLPMLEVACSRCERRGRLSVAKLIERHGADARLTDLRTVLGGDCPRVGAAIHEQSGVHYPQLVRL